MKKIGIVSCYFKHNYGSVLQAYATQVKLDKLGIENETINIEENISFKKGKRKYYINEITNIPFLKAKLGMVKLQLYKKINKNLKRNINIRNKKYEEFKKKFRLSKVSNSYLDLTEMINNYSNIIIGSDQLWLPVNVVADYYTLNWVPDNINKVALATSFGVSEVPQKYTQLYKNFLSRINKISVREESGVKLVKELSGKDAKLICDPTMLLTKKEWEDIGTKERIIKDRYILCYFLGKNIEHRKFAERLKEKTGCKIVSLNHADEYVKYSDIYADITPYDIGPEEWLNLVKNAEYVCTDSFHGTIFSIINNIPFFTFERYSNKNATISTNSRIYSLLSLFNLTDRLCAGNENIEEVLNNKIDFLKVNVKLDLLRNDAEYFLKNSINYNL